MRGSKKDLLHLKVRFKSFRMVFPILPFHAIVRTGALSYGAYIKGYLGRGTKKLVVFMGVGGPTG